MCLMAGRTKSQVLLWVPKDEYFKKRHCSGASGFVWSDSLEECAKITPSLDLNEDIMRENVTKLSCQKGEQQHAGFGAGIRIFQTCFGDRARRKKNAATAG